MNLEDAISVIESAAGFTDESTPVGEAWLVVLSYAYRVKGTDAIPVDFRALCAELVDSIETLTTLTSERRPMIVTEERLARARAALLQPAAPAAQP